MRALGLIEVDGYLAAIIASDNALKAANITLLGIETVKSGISCVKVTGDVDAVKAAVDAGQRVVKDMGLLRSAHVIPRLHEETEALISNNKAEVYDTSNQQKEVTIVDINKEKTEVIENNLIPQEIMVVKPVETINTIETIDNKLNYKDMKVDQLKNYVKKLKINNLTNKQIKLMKKNQLINILDNYFKHIKEGE